MTFHNYQLLFLNIICVFSLNHTLHGQRVAPGVPPQRYNSQQYQQQQQLQQQFQQQQQNKQQQYQQQPPPQQTQQAPVQQQKPVPVQHQNQVPAAQQPPQQQQKVQQPPVAQLPASAQAQQPIASGNLNGQNLLDASNIGIERKHIEEHLEVPQDTEKMSENELLFHYFKMHDTDSNGKLDGLELVKSVMHWQHHDHHDEKNGETPPQFIIYSDEDLERIVDPILKSDDKNGDGVIVYAEFNEAQLGLRNNRQRPG